MLVIDPVLRGVLLPAGVVLLVLLLAGRPWRRVDVASRSWAAGLALGAAYMSADLALHGVPGWPPAENWHWLTYAALAGTVIGVIDRRVVKLHPLPIFLRALACLAAAWVLVPDFPELANTRWVWIVGLASVSLLSWITLSQSADRVSNSVILIVLLSAFVTSCILMGYYSSNARFAQICGALLAGVGTCAIINVWRRDAIRLAGIAPLVALVFPGLTFNGYFHDWAGVPATSFLLVAAAPIALCLAWAPPLRRLRPATATIVVYFATLLPLAMALGLAVRAHEPGT